MADLIPAAAPAYFVKYGNTEETAVLDPYLVRLSITDSLGGKSDEVEIVLENRDGIFSYAYFPFKGDDIIAGLGWQNGPLEGMWDFGRFTIDEAQLQGPPDQLVIRATSASVKSEMKTPRSCGYENSTLKEVAVKVGDRLGYKVLIDTPDRKMKRITQYRETDLAFLNRLATENGLVMKIKGPEIVLMNLKKVQALDAGFGIQRSDVMSFSIRSKTSGTTRKSVTRFWDPTKRDQVKFLTKSEGLINVSNHPAPAPGKADSRAVLGSGPVPKVDIAKVFDRVEDAAHAQARMDASQHASAMASIEGNLKITGDPRVRAGANVYLFPDEFGICGGWYTVKRAKHTIDRNGGFVSDFDIAFNPGGPSDIPKKKESR